MDRVTQVVNDPLTSVNEPQNVGNLGRDQSENTPYPTLPKIFVDANELQLNHQVIDSFTSRRPMSKYRVVTVDSDLLRTLIRESTDEGFEIRLFDDGFIKLVTRGARESSSGWDTGIGTWVGGVADDEMSSASFIVGPDGSVNGVVHTAELGRIKIEPIKGTSHHLIWRFDSSVSTNID